MFEKCITCERLGQDCMPNLLILPFPDLLSWWTKKQKSLNWSNQTLSDISHIPKGTIDRIKQGDYDDCRYSTMRHILMALIGGVADEFPCKERLDKQRQRLEELEVENKRIAELEQENAALKAQLERIDTIHRSDIHTICEEYKDEIKFLKDIIRNMQTK